MRSLFEFKAVVIQPLSHFLNSLNPQNARSPLQPQQSHLGCAAMPSPTAVVTGNWRKPSPRRRASDNNGSTQAKKPRQTSLHAVPPNTPRR